MKRSSRGTSRSGVVWVPVDPFSEVSTNFDAKQMGRSGNGRGIM
jgi:hypothetical protein